MKILAAEDDRASRAILRRQLAGLGHEVIPAASGEEAWALWRTHRPAVVVSDWRMPKLDGLELCRRLRAQGEDEYVYFILLTASGASARNRRLAAAAGVDDFLTKPADVSELWMRLRVAERILRYTRRVNRLEELMPMCSYCKKVRDDRNYWQQIESYLNERTGAEVSHSVCPECYARVVMPELQKIRDRAARLPRGAARRKR
jgi:CheY-like chemotaxis protein